MVICGGMGGWDVFVLGLFVLSPGLRNVPGSFHHHAWLIFVFLLEMGFHHVGQAGGQWHDLGSL